MSNFPSSITLSIEEAVDILVVLDAATTTFTELGMLTGAAESAEAAAILMEKLTEDWPDHGG